MEPRARRILIADDDPAHAEIFRLLVAKVPELSASIDVYSDGVATLQRLVANTDYVAFVSLHFAVAGAAHWIREARTMGCRVPLVLVSDPGQVAADIEALRAGADDYLILGETSVLDVERSIRHVVGRRQSDQEMRERLLFDKLITNMSMRFVNLGPEEIDEQIRSSLRLLGMHTRSDRSFIFVRRKNETVTQEYEWCAPGVPARQPDSLPLDYHLFGWVAETLTNRGSLVISDPSQLPTEGAALREALKDRGVQSVALVPLLSRGTLTGAVGFSSIQGRSEWSRDSLRLLKIAGEILANAIEQRRVQQALRESELLYRSVVEGLGEGIIYCDREDLVIQVNSRLATLLGRQPSEMIGQKASDILVGPEEAPILRRYTQRRLTGVSEQYEIRLTRKDGSRFWARINATPIYNAAGEITGTLGAITDVSEQKEALEALRESEEKYRDLVETSSDIIWSVDHGGRVTFINNACRAVYGYAPEQLIGKSFVDSVDPSLRNQDLETFQQILLGKEIFQAETRHRRRDGSLVWLSINAIPLRSASGEIIGATGTASDISRRKQAEEDLRSQREFLRQVIDATPSLIFVKDHNFRFTLVNKAFADSYGMKPSELIGRTDHDIHPVASEAAGFVADCREVLDTMRPKIVNEFQFSHPLTREKQWHFSVRAPLLLPDGKPPQVLSVATDITKRKEAELEAIQLQKQLLQAQKMEAIGQLAAGVAHDLNNALGAVVGHLQLLDISADLSPAIKNSLQIALGGCERALSLIDQLLGFSRQGKYNLTTTSLRAIVDETVAFLSKVIEKDIEIAYQDCGEPLMVSVDAAQVQQALTNLIINAKHAMPRGGTIRFSFDCRRVSNPQSHNANAKPGNFAVLAVSDTGTGIDPSIIDKIFEPFFTTKRPEIAGQQGTGLGLAMVYGIMQNHGGWVEVESQLQRGSSFHLFFPRVEEHTRMTDQSSPKHETQPAKSGGLVLVIDDEPILVDLTKKFLDLAGIRSIGFTSGEEATTWYREHVAEVDLVVLDMKMAKMDGPACFELLRATNPNAKVAILSGYVQDAAVQDLMTKGALKFFQKPLKYPELVKWIASELAAA